MVLGFLLYEAVDLAWNFGGMTYRGGKYVYKSMLSNSNKRRYRNREIR